MEVKIGLEVHCQLNTKSKLFCSCKNEIAEKANTNVCPICLGYPGSKPVVNKEAIKKAIIASIALNCKINETFAFSRKVYFYPDMSKNYQITQYEMPIAKEGFIDIGKKIRIRRIHIEEDPARIVHTGNIKSEKYILIDYNRSGIPLIEIVTEPDFCDVSEVKKFLRKLISLLTYLKVFDPKKNTIKADVNVSVNGGERVEIKNVTGIKNIEKAIAFEIIRQKRIVEMGKKVERETRKFDEDLSITYTLRKKEEEEDYGYIFDTDLPIFESLPFVNEVRKEMVLPEEKINFLIEKYKISKELAKSIVYSHLFDLFTYLSSKFSDYNLIARLLGNYLKKCLNYNKISLEESKVKREDLLTLLKLVKDKKLPERKLKEIMKFYPLKGNLSKFIKEERVNVDEAIDKVLKENEKVVEDYKKGKEEAINFLIGEVLKKVNYNANAKEIRKKIIRILNETK